MRQLDDPLSGNLINRHADGCKTIVDNLIEFRVPHSRQRDLYQGALHRFVLGNQCIDRFGNANQNNGYVDRVIGKIFDRIGEERGGGFTLDTVEFVNNDKSFSRFCGIALTTSGVTISGRY